jgi:hypothetical protein
MSHDSTPGSVMPRSEPIMCRILRVFSSPACVTNCAEQSKPTNRNSRNGDIVCAIDFVRASSRSPSFLGGRVDACVGWRDKSGVDELDDVGGRNVFSLDSKEPFVSFIASISSFDMLRRSRGSFSCRIKSFHLYLEVSHQSLLGFLCLAINMFLYVEEMGLCQQLLKKAFSQPSLRERGITTWTRSRHRVRHPHVGPLASHTLGPSWNFLLNRSGPTSDKRWLQALRFYQMLTVVRL